MVDLHRLRVFRAVVAEGSINGAASQLGYTASAISQQVSALQRETGLTLIERDGRGISPTSAGVRLAAEAEAVLQQLAALESIAQDLREGRVGRIVLSYFGSVGAAWIPQIVALLRTEFPSLRLDLRLNELPGAEALHPDLDIFVVDAPGPEYQPPGYTTEVLLADPFMVALPADHPWADREQIGLAELRDEIWIDNDVARGPCRQTVMDACAAQGFVPCFQVEAHDYRTGLAFVARGIGISVMPQLGVHEPPAGVVIRPIVDPVPERVIALRVKDAVAAHPAVTRTRDLLHEAARLAG